MGPLRPESVAGPSAPSATAVALMAERQDPPHPSPWAVRRRRPPRPRASHPFLLSLLAEAERVDEPLVAVEVLALQVVEQAAAQADHAKEPAPRMVILGVGLQVLGEMGDAL